MELRKNGFTPVVLLLDISNSVKGEAFSQMKEAFVSLIQGNVIFFMYGIHNISILEFKIHHNLLSLVFFSDVNAYKN